MLHVDSGVPHHDRGTPHMTAGRSQIHWGRVRVNGVRGDGTSQELVHEGYL